MIYIINIIILIGVIINMEKSYDLELFTKIGKFQNLEAVAIEDIEQEYDKWEEVLDSLSEEDYSNMISLLCKQYTKEQLAVMVLSQTITLKFNEFNLAFYELLKRKINMTEAEREEEKRRQYQEVYLIFHNEILRDKKIRQNKHDMKMLIDYLAKPLIKYASKYPVKIRLSNYELSEYTENMIKDKLRKYIKIID